MSHEIQILNHLRKYGSITAIDALKNYKCFRLAARIYDIRRYGINILTLKINKNNKTFAKYILLSDDKK